MPVKDLNAFLRMLERRGELVRITALVSPVLEITEIADRVSKLHGKALLFENVEGSEYPLLINAFGSYERMSWALGAKNLEDIAADIERYLDFSNYASLRRLIAFSPKLLRLLCCFPLKRRIAPGRPPCREVIQKTPDLSALPILKCWPLDGGRFLTLPLVFTRWPDTGNQNVGMYRMQVLDQTTTAMHWHKHKDGAGIYEAYRQKGRRRMPVSVALGCSPAVTYAATAPLPPGLDEMMLAGFLQRRPVRMAKCVTNDIFVPVEAQFVLEGYVDTEEELAWEGPFGDHTGYYSLAGWYPKFHVTAVTHRRNAVYPATVVGRPPMEDCYMAKATERIFLPFLRLLVPQIRNMNLPFEGVFHNLAILSVRKDFPGAPQTVMNYIWGMGQMKYTKMIVIVDESVDPYDTGRVLSEVLANTDFKKDLVLSEGPLDALDHSSEQPLFGARLGIDATSKPGRPEGASPFHGFSCAPVHKTAAWEGRKAALGLLGRSAVRLAVAVDEGVDISDQSAVMWRLLNNIDVSRDLTVTPEGRAALDATRKLPEEGLSRSWPSDIEMSGAMRKHVDRRWEEYGLAALCPNGKEVCS